MPENNDTIPTPTPEDLVIDLSKIYSILTKSHIDSDDETAPLPYIRRCHSAESENATLKHNNAWLNGEYVKLESENATLKAALADRDAEIVRLRGELSVFHDDADLRAKADIALENEALRLDKETLQKEIVRLKATLVEIHQTAESGGWWLRDRIQKIAKRELEAKPQDAPHDLTPRQQTQIDALAANLKAAKDLNVTMGNAPLPYPGRTETGFEDFSEGEDQA